LKKIVEAEILRNFQIADDIFEMALESAYLADYSEAGQFVGVYLDLADKLLPRPFGICRSDKKRGTILFIYRVTGEGTRLLSAYPQGKKLRVMGPCGTGFSYIPEQKITITIVGGGMGAPPLFMLAEEIKSKDKNAEIDVFLGFGSTGRIILRDEFKKLGCNVYIATDDGSEGFCGGITEFMASKQVAGGIIYACGPFPMLKAVCAYARANNARAQVSLEERMACGIGACFCCPAKVKSEGGYEYKKVCKHGPVFWSTEVVWDD